LGVHERFLHVYIYGFGSDAVPESALASASTSVMLLLESSDLIVVAVIAAELGSVV
jgi:hypothetical protein